MSYAYIPRTSKRQEKINFCPLTSRSLETFGVFNRLFRDIQIHSEGAMEEKRNKALAAKQKTEPGRIAVLK
jgi:hypothetical protein